MEDEIEEISTKENILNTITGEDPEIDNNILSMDELVARVSLLSKNHNPYSVSKEIEEIKSIFYTKLKTEKKEALGTEELEKEEKSKEKLHPLEVKFKNAFDIYRKIKSEFRKRKEKKEEENLKIKRTIIEDIDALVKEEESIKITFEKFRELQARWREIGHVPITENNHLWQSYHHHVELFYDFIKINNDLRDLDFKRNLEEKNIICAKAEALLEERSINKAHNNLQELHEHWKNVGPVERTLREPLWERFQEISKKINKRRNDYFIEKKKENSIKLDLKNIIAKEIEDITFEEKTSHNQWQEATTKCRELEKKWKALGKLSKESNKIAWGKLREVLNNFYSAKNNFYKQKKIQRTEILNEKLAICEKAERLQDSTDWKKTGDNLIKLQEEWKNSEFSPSTQSNEIWIRFRKACNIFFNNRKKYYKEIKKQEAEAYKEKKALIKELEGLKLSSKSKENIKKIKAFNSRWDNIKQTPKDKKSINTQFLNLLNSKFEELGLDKEALATEKYKNKISSLKGNSRAINREQELLKKRIDNLEKVIAQYENNISFFGNGKATMPLLDQTQKQIDNAKSDIKDLQQKIQMLNKA
ncbi:MAG: hypothetical protein CMD19_04780 [Flavobacteriales bacterium]|nr:hypothetical protein [Flavobacteriales bacterium]